MTICMMHAILLCLVSIVTLNSAYRRLTSAEIERRRREDLVLFPMYPKSAPVYHIRRNPYSKTDEPVSRGRFDLINGIPDIRPGERSKKFTIAQFKKHLQCNVAEPAHDELYGTLSQMLLTPPTRETIEMVALWAETKCWEEESTWRDCYALLPKFRNKQYPKTFPIEDKFGWRFQLVRISNGELLYDWPWGMERVTKHYAIGHWMFAPLAMVVNLLTDVKDSVFLFGAEAGYVPWTFNIAHLTMAGSMGDFLHATNSIVWPWEQEFAHELQLYETIYKEYGGDFSQVTLRNLTNTLAWDEKKETRAALYASSDNSRWVLFEVAARHPDLFKFSTNEITDLFCWTSECTIKFWQKEDYPTLRAAARVSEPTLPGIRLLNYTHNPPQRYHPGHFKYVVVPSGMSGQSTSSRLLYLLAHCECVVLLVNSHLQYHISPRLQPWVHYVPLATSGADVAAKVWYLQQHDDLARQIAQNGYNFGQSYLRLEDYLCYAASTVEALGEVMQGTTALHPFAPVRLFDPSIPNDDGDE